MKPVKPVIAVLLAAITLGAKAQTADLEKKIAKSEKLVESGKYEDAEKLMMGALSKYPYSYEGWNALSTAQLYIYEQKQQSDKSFAGFKITATNAEGKDISNDSTVQTLKNMLESYKPSDSYKRHILNTGRVATCMYRGAVTPAVLIRIYYVDSAIAAPKPDANKQFNLAEKEFQSRNYTAAANYYKKAIELDPNFYKAKLYLGDVYYATKRYNLAITEFKEAVNTRPDLIEPRKYLIDALAKSDQYEQAFAESVEGMMVYPDVSLMVMVEDAAQYAGNSNYSLHWVQRGVLPNSKTAKGLDEVDMPLKIEGTEHWRYYAEALDKVKAHTNAKGIIGTNETTQEKYLEVYSWEYMLAKSDAKQLEFARKMKEKGYLDCYVLISNFHYDLLEQYRDLVANNRDKVKSYFELLKAYN